VPRKAPLKATDRLIEAEARTLGQRVPEPLQQRLIELCDAVYDAGEPHRPTKADLIAALILAAPEDPDELVALIGAYGRATVGDALLARPAEGDVIQFAPRTSGPRRRSG
jgi:hypothetical protein